MVAVYKKSTLSREVVHHMNDINLNSHCVNANIKAHILSNDQMQTAGFRYIKINNKKTASRRARGFLFCQKIIS